MMHDLSLHKWKIYIKWWKWYAIFWSYHDADMLEGHGTSTKYKILYFTLPWDKFKVQDSILHFVFLQHKSWTIVVISVYLMSAPMLCHPPTYIKDLKGHDTSKILAVEFVLDLVNSIFDYVKMWILIILQPSTCILMKEALMWTMIPCPIAILLNKIHKVSWNTLIFHETDEYVEIHHFEHLFDEVHLFRSHCAFI